MKALCLTEFKRNLKSLMLWTAIVSGLVLLMILLFPAFETAFADIEDFLSVYPPEFLEIFGMGEGGIDMATIDGWYGIEGYLFMTLIGGSYAAILGSSILSKEEDEKTIEFLLSEPVSRTQVFFSKALVVLTNIILMNIINGIVLLVAFLAFDAFDPVVWLLFTFAPVILQSFFAGIAMLSGIFITRARKVMSVSLGLSLGTYVLLLISKLTDEGEWLKYLTPYEYVNSVDIVTNKTIQPVYLLITLVVVASSVVLAWRLYLKKDISV
jgi:ABC-2 type transport system permease protein